MAFEGSFSGILQDGDPREWRGGDKLPIWVSSSVSLESNSLASYGLSTGMVPASVLGPRRLSRAHLTHNDNRVRRWQSRKPRDAEGTLMSTLAGYEKSLRAAPDQSIINHHRDLRIARLVKKNVAEAKAKGLSSTLVDSTSSVEEDKEAQVGTHIFQMQENPLFLMCW
jgi:hypothetical protein